MQVDVMSPAQIHGSHEFHTFKVFKTFEGLNFVALAALVATPVKIANLTSDPIDTSYT